MSGFDRILIALELGGADDSTLAYADLLLGLMHPGQVDVVHVIEARPVSDENVAAHPALMQESLRRGEQRLREQVAGRLEESASMTLRFHVRVGAPLHELLDLSLHESVELIITGRNPNGPLVDTLPERIARESLCPVLVVPAGSRARIQELLLPLDFSEDSRCAMRVAADLADRCQAPHLQGLHAYALPAGQEHSRITESEMGDMMRAYAVHAYALFRAGEEALPVAMDIDYVLDADPAHAVLQTATAERFDLVVLGARGDSVSSQAPLGHVATRVLRASSVPVLVTRHLKESQRILKTAMALRG